MFQSLHQLYRESYPGRPTYTEKDYPDLSGRVFIVTGGCTGIGFYVTRYLAEKNAKVWIVARNQSKIDEGIAKIKEEFPNANLESFLVDFSDLQTVKRGVQKFLDLETRLDVVIHNAGVMTPPPGSQTKDGYELQLGTNNLGPWLLQKYLDPVLLKTAKSSPANSCRVIFVSSAAHRFSPSNGGVNWDDLQNVKTTSKFTIYGQSKAINMYMAALWAREHKDSGVVSLSLHPGNLRTELQRHVTGIQHWIIDRMLHPANYGAYTELYAALNPSLTCANNGDYISPWGRIGVPRPDVKAGMEGAKADKVFEYLEKETAKFQ
jgi:protochlorophyllide reductase